MEDFLLELAYEDVEYELRDDDVQVIVRNTMDKLSQYCQNPRIVLDDPDYVDATQLRFIHYIQDIMQSERRPLMDFSYCRLVRIDPASVVIKFFGGRPDADAYI